MKAKFLLLFLMLTGCAAMSQESDLALIREPGKRTYSQPPEKVVESARTLWEYAVLSDNAYLKASLAQLAKTEEGKACSLDREDRLDLRDWKQWPDVPSPALEQEAREVDLQLEVWEKQSSPPIVAVVFRGTEAESWGDWQANLRWFLRFIPWFRDQYMVVSEKVGAAVLEKIKGELERGSAKYGDAQIVSTGHSLGGGLAQHLAYSFPEIKRRGREADASGFEGLWFRSVAGYRVVFRPAKASRNECERAANRPRLRARRNPFVYPVDPQVSKSAARKRSRHP
jgi:hypothetical protein